MSRDALRLRLADLVATATDGEVAADDVLAADASLTDLGVGSLGFLRLIDAVEAEYGIELTLDGEEPLPDTIDAFADRLVREGLRPAGA
jgi:acyl carrier protein